MRNFTSIAIASVLLLGLTACSSPPTKSVRTTTTTTSTDESGASTASAHSELRTHVPVTTELAPPMGGSSTSSTTTVNGPYGNGQTVEQSRTNDGNGTTTVQKRVTNY